MKIFPVYIFIGDDDKKVKSEVAKLEDSFPRDIEKELHFTDDVNIDTILPSLNNLSLFGSSKIVKIYNFEKYLNEFAEYSKNPNTTTILILISYKEAKELDTKLKKFDTKNSLIKTVTRSKNVSSDVLSALDRLNVKLTPDAKKYIVENFEKSGDSIDVAEILSSIPEKEGGLTVEDIYPHLTGTHNIFLFLDHVFGKNLKEALIEFNKMFNAGESLIGVLFQLHNNLVRVWQVKAVAGKINENEIAKSLSIHPFVAKKCLSHTKSFSFDKMKNLFYLIQKTDLILKSSDPHIHKIAIEKLIIHFCSV